MITKPTPKKATEKASIINISNRSGVRVSILNVDRELSLSFIFINQYTGLNIAVFFTVSLRSC